MLDMVDPRIGFINHAFGRFVGVVYLPGDEPSSKGIRLSDESVEELRKVKWPEQRLKPFGRRGGCSLHIVYSRSWRCMMCLGTRDQHIPLYRRL